MTSFAKCAIMLVCNEIENKGAFMNVMEVP